VTIGHLLPDFGTHLVQDRGFIRPGGNPRIVYGPDFSTRRTNISGFIAPLKFVVHRLGLAGRCPIPTGYIQISSGPVIKLLRNRTHLTLHFRRQNHRTVLKGPVALRDIYPGILKADIGGIPRGGDGRVMVGGGLSVTG